MKLKQLLNKIGLLLTIFSIVCVVISLKNLDIQINLIKDSPNLIIISFIGIIIAVSSVILMAYSWGNTLAFFSPEKIIYKDAFLIYMKANLGKYIPGNVMHYVERNLYASNMGLSHSSILGSTIIEILSITGISIILSLIFLPGNSFKILRSIITGNTLLFWGLVVAFFSILFFYFAKKYNNKYLCIKSYLLNTKFLCLEIRICFVYSIVLISLGLILVLICKYVFNISFTLQEAFFGISCYILSWAIGFIVPGAPGGIGIREFVLIFLLKNSINEDIILLAAVIHRGITIIGDILTYVMATTANLLLSAKK